MKGIDNPSSRLNSSKRIIGSPPTGQRLSLVQNIQTENETIHHKLTLSTFFSLTLHSLGIIFGDM
jgi:hypothetical protein